MNSEELKVIITAEVSKFKKAMGDAKAEFKDFKSQIKNVDTKTLDANFKKLGDGINKAMKIGAAGVTALVGALAGAALGTQQFQADMAALDASFSQANLSADSATATVSRLYGVIGETDQAVEASQQIALLANSEKEAAQWADLASGVFGTFTDAMQPEMFYEAANETLKLNEATGAFVQMLEGTGVMSVEEFNAALAACTTEEEKQALMLEVSQQAMGEAGAAWDAATTKLQEQRQAQLEMETALAGVGAAVAPVITAFMSFAADALAACTPYLSEIANKLAPVLAEVLGQVASALADAYEWASQHKALLITMGAIILVVVAAIAAYNAVAVIKAAMAALEVTTVWGLVAAYTAQAAAMLVALAPYLLIAAAIAAVIAVLVVAYQKSETFRAIVTNVFNNVKDIITKAMNIVRSVISSVWSSIQVIWDSYLKYIVEAVVVGLALLVEDFTGKLNAIMTIVSTVFTAISSVIKSSMETVKTIVDNVLKLVKAIITGDLEGAKQAVVNIFNAIKNHIQTILEAAKAIVLSKIDAIKVYFSNGFGAAKQTVANIFDSIKSSIESKINAAKDKVQSAIDKIKSIMNFSWSLPKLKLPHISIKGSFSLMPPSVPTFSIAWYAKGGVFDSPHLFGYGNGALGGLGENGAEAVVPLEKNTEWLDRIAERLYGKQGDTPIILQVDGVTLARTTVDGINQLTKQTGSLPLVLA